MLKCGECDINDGECSYMSDYRLSQLSWEEDAGLCSRKSIFDDKCTAIFGNVEIFIYN